MATKVLRFSSGHIEYLERAFLRAPLQLEGPLRPPPADAALVRITGLNRLPETHRDAATATRILMQDALTGWANGATQLGVVVAGNRGRVALYMGLFSESGDLAIRRGLASAYPGVTLTSETLSLASIVDDADEELRYAAMIVGTPTVKIGDEASGTPQIERLIKGLYDGGPGAGSWCLSVRAQPTGDEEAASLYRDVLKEARVVADADQSRNPVAARYAALLESLVDKLEAGKRTGLWHVSASILTSDPSDLERAGMIAKSVFGGAGSRPDPLQVIDAGTAAAAPGLLDRVEAAPPDAPGVFAYPFAYCSLLNSTELAALVHLPFEEMPGFFVRSQSRFDVAKRPPTTVPVDIGEIDLHGAGTGRRFAIEARDLDKHALVVGTTGSGKTNTVFHVLRQCAEAGIPFLVIEPAKAEYRSLLQDEFVGQALQVYTPGAESISPFRVNPFEVRPGVNIQTHLDRLRSVFNATFAMYAPMPHVLERCLHEIYEDAGWDLVSGENARGVHADAHPTLTDLSHKIDPVVQRLGYDRRITMDVSAALKTRIQSLRVGGKGLMLDTPVSIPLDVLFGTPVVLELEHIGDPDEKAFVMGLVLMALGEHLQTTPRDGDRGLRHVTVVEEAHRLLTNTPPAFDPETANVRGKAVETFCDLLAEVRAYGEGMLICDQIPGKLAPDVLKNTSLKIMHRIVAGDDRAMMGASMVLDPEQQRTVASLDVGQAAVFATGEDGAFLVRVPRAKTEAVPVSHDMVRTAMAERGCWREGLAPSTDPTLTRTARLLASQPEIIEAGRRLVLNTALSADVDNAQLGDLRHRITRLSPGSVSIEALFPVALEESVRLTFKQLGRYYGWPYNETSSIRDAMLELLELKLRDQDVETPAETFSVRFHGLHRVESFPYWGCALACPRSRCLYRHHLSPLVVDSVPSSQFAARVRKLDDPASWVAAFDAALRAARRAIGSQGSREHLRRAALCFAIQRTERMEELDGRLCQSVVAGLVGLSQEPRPAPGSRRTDA